MSDKPKVAFYWCASCGGCEESVVDLAEDILDVVNAVDIVFWPVAMDFKKSDVEKMEDKSILVSMINGAVRTSEQAEMARLLRKKSKLVVAYGACAQMGGIPALANQFEREQIMKYVYEDSPSTINDRRDRPQTKFKHNEFNVELPEFHNLVRALDQVIDVDLYLPGCPPTPKLLKEAINALLAGNIPEKGTILSPDIALCNECPRKDTKPVDMAFDEYKRPHKTELDPKTCFLAQKLICMGPATRGGCEALCINGNMPCSGCFGPTNRVKDQGAKMLSSITSSITATEEKEIDKILEGIPDPVGTFYRYGLSKCLLKRKLT